ncbi:MAG: hypothetical protein IKW67_00705 [Alphaproteobacteria bacterium]|nr:hypothetical protein [Alphaproteobacteria bacterium]
MLRKIQVFFTVLLMSVCAPTFAANLSGVALVSITSDTAANAKSIAFDEARRQIISDSLRQYADVATLIDALKNAKNTDLAVLVSQSSISGEKTSDTMYAATISMTLDSNAVQNWLDVNGVKNWLPDDSVVDVFVVMVDMKNPLIDWIQLNQIARNMDLDLGTKYFVGNTVHLNLPKSKRGAFTIALRDAGWRYADNDGILKIWK